MSDLLNQLGQYTSEAMREGDDSYTEFLQSDLHVCDKMIRDYLLIFQTPDNRLKMMPNSSSIMSYPISCEIKCCPWCGFQPEDKDD